MKMHIQKSNEEVKWEGRRCVQWAVNGSEQLSY